MPYVSPEEVRAAKQMDLLTYLQSYEPNELVKLSMGTYCTRQHDSLKISNGKWHWFSRGIGGTTALDYLIKVQNYRFPEAVETILGRVAARPPTFYTPRAEQSILEPGKPYTKEDGTTGTSFNVKRVFDISQTNSTEKVTPTVTRDERLLLKALITHAPCQLKIRNNIPLRIIGTQSFQPTKLT